MWLILLQAYGEGSSYQDPDFTETLQQTEEGYWLQGKQIVVPDTPGLRRAVIAGLHASPLAGHAGIVKTTQATTRIFWWPGMRRDVERFVQECHACQTNKASNQAPGGLLQPLPIPERMWECVSMDLITGLPQTQAGHDAIAVFVYKLSRMVHFVYSTYPPRLPCRQEILQKFTCRMLHA